MPLGGPSGASWQRPRLDLRGRLALMIVLASLTESRMRKEKSPCCRSMKRHIIYPKMPVGPYRLLEDLNGGPYGTRS